MKPLDLRRVEAFVEHEIGVFHRARLSVFESLDLSKLAKRKNPYLARAKNVTRAQDLVEHWLNAYLSSSEEEHFGQFMERLAVFIASETCDIVPNAPKGVDLVFLRAGVYHIVQIKSGPNWGNADQHKSLKQNFIDAGAFYAPRAYACTLGICYGRQKLTTSDVYTKRVGKHFWHFISDDPQLYLTMVEPIGYQARQRNEAYQRERDARLNVLTGQVLSEFCKPNGEIDWQALVKRACG
jgi:hypothetical protein